MNKITVNDTMQENYTYYLTEPVGKNFHHDFKSDRTHKIITEGVFKKYN